MKILAIGNSFSVDSLYYLWKIAENDGVNHLILGNLVIGGAPLQLHLTNAKDDLKAYRYDKNTAGAWNSSANTSIAEALEDEEWDMISLQQASGFSGLAESYDPYLNELLDYLAATKPKAKVIWNMTWAYPHHSNHAAFPRYNKDQLTMYNMILDTVQKKIVTNNRISGIFPTGTTIQNVRTSYVGDTLNRDGNHLNDAGRYVAALSWFKSVTGRSLQSITYVPETVPGEYLDVFKESVEHAYAAPFAVTKSRFTEGKVLHQSSAVLNLE